MQASQATTVAVRLQPLAYMTQFLHTNINRAGIFHLTTSSVVEGLQFRPDYSSIRRKQNHPTSLFSRLLLSSSTVLTVSLSRLSQKEALTGINRVAGENRPLFKTTCIQVQVAYRGQHSTDIVGAKGYFFNGPHLSRSWKLEALRGAEPHCVLKWMHFSADGFAASVHI